MWGLCTEGLYHNMIKEQCEDLTERHFESPAARQTN